MLESLDSVLLYAFLNKYSDVLAEIEPPIQPQYTIVVSIFFSIILI